MKQQMEQQVSIHPKEEVINGTSYTKNGDDQTIWLAKEQDSPLCDYLSVLQTV